MTPKRRRVGVDTGDDPTLDDDLPDRATTPHLAILEPGDSLLMPPPLEPVDTSTIAPGTMLGDYRVDHKLGQGGMGDVYLGVHALIGKRAAIKVLKAELCADKFSVERFIAEARVVNQIGNPNIVDVFAFGQTPDGRSFLVMELLQGETLRDRIARGRVDIAELCEIARPLVRALVAAHAQGVVHRDLKPDNVFLVSVPDEKPTVKLLDFGIAKLVRTDKQMQQTASGALVGTPMYIAPEQARASTVDHRADIYTLGGILFEMVTGRPPFVASTAFEVVAMHLMEPPEHPAAFLKVPAELDELIVEMLAKAPEMRPTLAEVSRVLEGLANPDRPTTPLSFDHEHFMSNQVTKRRVSALPRRVTDPPQSNTAPARPSQPSTPSGAHEALGGPASAAFTTATLPKRGRGSGLAIGFGVFALCVAAVVMMVMRRPAGTKPPADAATNVVPMVITPVADAGVMAVDASVDAAPAVAEPIDAGGAPKPTNRTVPHGKVPPRQDPPKVDPLTGSAAPRDDALLERGTIPKKQ